MNPQPMLPQSSTPRSPGCQLAAVILALVLLSPGLAQEVRDPSFEEYVLPAGQYYEYSNTLASHPAWEFSANAGLLLTPGGAGFLAPPSPAGRQAALLQAYRGALGSIRQAITFPSTGRFQLRWLDAGRSAQEGGNAEYVVRMDTQVIARRQTTTGQPFTPRSAEFEVGAGVHVLEFAVVGPTDGDQTSLIDDLVIEAVAPSAPIKTRVGGVVANEVWTKEQSPYGLTNDVYVSASLTIREGVEIRVEGDYVLEAAGRLRVIGTADEPVRFHPSDPSTAWQGLLFRDAVPNSYLLHTIIEGSRNSGVRITNSPPAFTNCVFTRNSAPANGGAIAATVPESPLVMNGCQFTWNSAGSSGGAIYLQGKAVLRGSSLQQNHAVYEGAGIWAAGDCLLSDCALTSNTVAAIYGTIVRLEQGHLRLENAHLSGNHGPHPESTILWANGEANLVNCLIAGNEGRALGAISGSAVLVNCTVAGNTGVGIYANEQLVRLTNSIVYGNNAGGSQISLGNGGAVGFAYSCVQGGVPPGPGNLSVPPALCQDSYALIEGSPCIDAGHPGLEFRDGLRRDDACGPFARGTERNDMGAFGGPGVCYWTEPRAEPVLRIAPLNRVGLVGHPVTLSALATGREPLSYRWYQDGRLLDGQTGSLLTLSSGSLKHIGTYFVEVRNELGTMTSAPVRLGIAQFEARPDGLNQGRPRLLIRNGQAGQKCALYTTDHLPPGEGLTVPGNAPSVWELREILTFFGSEITWVDPEVLDLGTSRFYGVVPVD